jgi:hypothetical protein
MGCTTSTVAEPTNMPQSIDVNKCVDVVIITNVQHDKEIFTSQNPEGNIFHILYIFPGIYDEIVSFVVSVINNKKDLGNCLNTTPVDVYGKELTEQTEQQASNNFDGNSSTCDTQNTSHSYHADQPEVNDKVDNATNDDKHIPVNNSSLHISIDTCTSLNNIATGSTHITTDTSSTF